MPLPYHVAQAVGLAGWTAFWRRYYQFETREDEVHFVDSDDGWRLALSRYRARGRSRRAHPVVLCHGLAASRIGFDLDLEHSLALHLAGRGYDVWALELRGHGRSERPSLLRPRGKRYGWSFDDYLLRDLPAAIHRVLNASGREELHWIGHSMGGLLLFSHLALGRSGIRSAVTVGSSLTYHDTPSDFHAMLRLRGLTQVLPMIPLGHLASAGAPLSGRTPNRIEEFNLYAPNVEPQLNRRLHATGFHPVSSPVLRQLATAMEPEGLASADGQRRYAEGLGQAAAPVLALAGDLDRQCAPQAVENTLARLGSADKQLQVFGKREGQPTHYGHFDLLIGKRAHTEVWPHIDMWLDRWD